MNAQGGASGALTYSGALPLSYVQHITSLTSYGQLAYTGTDTKLTSFSITPESNLAAGTYTNILTGVGAIDSGAKGKIGNYRWQLANSGAGWDLILRLYPDMIKTLTELGYGRDEVLSARRNRAATTASAVGNECADFGKGPVCIGLTFRYSNFDNADESAGVLTAAYQVSRHLRAGAFVDYTFNRSSTAMRLAQQQKLPMFGGFIGYTQRADGLGLQVKISAAYSAEDMTLTRSNALDTTEAGAGAARLKNWAVGGEAGYRFKVSDKLLVAPYVGLRQGYAGRSGYTEQQTAEVEFPVTYLAYSQQLTTGRGGIQLGGQLMDQLSYSLAGGVEYDLASKASPYAGSTTIPDLLNFALDDTVIQNRLRGHGTLELAYGLAQGIKLTLGASIREEAYSKALQTNARAGLRIGF